MNTTKIKLYQVLIYLGGIMCFSSCAFNKTFFHPAKISGKPTGNFSFTIDTVRTFVEMDVSSLNPLLIKVEEDTLDFPFSIEGLTFFSESGNQLNGWFLKPKDQVPKYTILHFHGSAGFLYNQYQNMAPLLDKGYQVFMFDYSGFGFSKGKPTRKNVLLDANAALDFLKNGNEIKNTPLIIYGQSYGGYLAAIVGSRRQDEIDGLVIEGAFSSHKKEAVYTIPFFGNLVKEGIVAKKEIKKYNKPLLVIHSNEDKRVPIRMGREIFENANEPKYFYEVDQSHIAALHFYADEISNKIKNMFLLKSE